jgi:hypothetical protein
VNVELLDGSLRKRFDQDRSCKICELLKPAEDFGPRLIERSGRRYVVFRNTCKSCRAALAREERRWWSSLQGAA